MSLKVKIIGGFALTIFIFFISAGIIYSHAINARGQVMDIPHQFTRNNQYNQIAINMGLQAASIRGFLYYRQDSYISDVEKYSNENKAIIQNLVDTAKLASNRDKAVQLQELMAKNNDLTLNKVIPMVKAGKEEEAMNLARTEGAPTTGKINTMIAEMRKSREDVLSKEIEETGVSVGNIRYWALASAILALIFASVIAFLLSRSIAGPIQMVSAGASRIAGGDLSGSEIKVNTRDEIMAMAGAFNQMQTNLREIVRQLAEKSQTVAASSAQLSASAENVSAGAMDTAANINNVAVKVEQITANTRQMAESFRIASDYAKEGKEGISKVTVQMEEIQGATGYSREVINGLNQSAEKISQIVELITQIADQTNLLALNAAIEAARAGEQGRGFAVVAEEVRKLAEESSGAAKEIYNIISNIQRESGKGVQSMAEAASKVDEGADTVKKMGETFESIIAAVQDLAKEVQMAVSAVEDMSSSVQNVAAASQEQTATMEEVSSTSNNLASLATDLESIAGKFKLARI
jgi:methyl-accepting chemotaxis protein